MPYIISGIISEDMPSHWFEKKAYSKENLYSIQEGKLPPVNYDTHIINSHSLTHIEGARHTQADGKTVDQYFNNPNYFCGKCQVIKLKGNNYKLVDQNKGIYHWEVTIKELKEALAGKTPQKILLTTLAYPKNEHLQHDPNYVLTLSLEAAEYLISFKEFTLYGTTWKSSDFKPGSTERPIHNKLFEKAVIMECLDLEAVPEGEYFLSAFPLNIKGASESPVTPILFSKDEINNIF